MYFSNGMEMVCTRSAGFEKHKESNKSRHKNEANFPIPVAYPHYVTLPTHMTYEVRRERSTMGYPMVTP